MRWFAIACCLLTLIACKRERREVRLYGFSWKRSEGLKSLGGLADRSIWSETGEQGTPTLDFSRQD
jgi:hypothetical protein